MTDRTDELMNAAKSGDREKAERLGNVMKETLSADKKEMLERALKDKEYLKALLESDKAQRILKNLENRGEN